MDDLVDVTLTKDEVIRICALITLMKIDGHPSFSSENNNRILNELDTKFQGLLYG